MALDDHFDTLNKLYHNLYVCRRRSRGVVRGNGWLATTYHESRDIQE